MIEQYFKDNYRVLLKRIQARGMQPADAEDVVQETFLRALKYKDSLVGNHIEPWMSGILNNAFKDYRRANFTGDYSFASLDEDEEDLLDPNTVVEGIAMNKNLAARVKKETAKLNPKHAHIIQLVLLNGYKQKEAAQALGEKFENVKKIVFRFQQAMRQKYNE